MVKEAIDKFSGLSGYAKVATQLGAVGLIFALFTWGLLAARGDVKEMVAGLRADLRDERRDSREERQNNAHAIRELAKQVGDNTVAARELLVELRRMHERQ